MAKKNSDVAQRAWKIFRLALLWARKGGVFKRRLMMELRLVPKFLKNLGHIAPRDQIHYGERELSFDKTPNFQVKMHRPASMRFNIPCITSQVDFDYDFDEVREDYQDGVYGYYDGGRKSFLKGGDGVEYGCEDSEERIHVEEEDIDLKAEQFIAKFYEQTKLQRHNSYLQYNETQNKITC